MSHDSGIPDAIPFRTLERTPGMLKGAIPVLVLLGVVAAFLSMVGEPGRFWEALLFNWLFWSSLAIGMVMFAVALHLTHANWAWSIRRFALGGAAFLPISFLLLIVVLFGSEHYFHHWLHVVGDPVIDAKRAWLNLPGLVTRNVLGVAILFGAGLAFAYYALRPDVYGTGTGRHRPIYDRLTGNWRGVAQEARHSRQVMNKLAPVLGLLFVFLWGMVAIDLAMSLMPHWFSTMFPVAFFWTSFHGGVAATAIAVALLRKPLRLQDYITVRQFHDLGKLLFAFSVFWMYLNWSQYIVIWYGLLPWEQEFFVQRFQAPFTNFALAVPLLVFVVPFFGLLGRPPKQVPAILAGFAALILVGHWLERFLLIIPALYEGDHAPMGLPEIGIGLGFAGLFLASYLWYLRTFPLLPSPATLASEEPALVPVPVSAASHHA